VQQLSLAAPQLVIPGPPGVQLCIDTIPLAPDELLDEEPPVAPPPSAISTKPLFPMMVLQAATTARRLGQSSANSPLQFMLTSRMLKTVR
jgi:hypothetical protein